MSSARLAFASLPLVAVLAPVLAPVSAQAAVGLSPGIQLSAGGTNVWIYNSPSEFGDLSYKGVPQNRTTRLDAAGVPLGVNLITINDVFLGDVDWPGGPPDFYDIGISTSSAAVAFDTLTPDYFTAGGLTALISLGNSGLPHPCVPNPASSCTNSTQCPPLLTGYDVDIALSQAIPLLSGSDGSSGNHMIHFLPAGMVFSTSGTVGGCGNGDYVFMGSQSLSEAQAELTNIVGNSLCEGFALGPAVGVPASGPIADTKNTMLEINFGIREPSIEPEITDPGAAIPYGPVRGGAGLGVDTSSGVVSLAAHVTANNSLAGALCFPAASLSALPAAVSLFGANLLIAPDGTFNATLASWASTGALAPIAAGGTGVFTHAEAVTSGLTLPAIAGVRVYLQAFLVTGFAPIQAQSTTRWAIDLR